MLRFKLCWKIPIVSDARRIEFIYNTSWGAEKDVKNNHLPQVDAHDASYYPMCSPYEIDLVNRESYYTSAR